MNDLKILSNKGYLIGVGIGFVFNLMVFSTLGAIIGAVSALAVGELLARKELL